MAEHHSPLKATIRAAWRKRAREEMKLRHAPLLVAREMARLPSHRALVAETLARIIQRPDEMTELLAIYWADSLGPQQQRKRQPVSAQVKKGLARALTKFDAYQLAKYDRDGAVRIRPAALANDSVVKNCRRFCMTCIATPP